MNTLTNLHLCLSNYDSSFNELSQEMQCHASIGLGDPPVSEFYVSTFRNTVCSIFIGRFKQEEFFLLKPTMKMELTVFRNFGT